MKNTLYQGPERRRFKRFPYVKPLEYKVCKKETISKLLEGYTHNVSESGLLCTIKGEVKESDIVWLSFDRSTLIICEELDKRCFIYQHGIIGKIVRLEQHKDESYDVAVQFITREEQNLTHIYPKAHFARGSSDEQVPDADAEETLEQDTEEENADMDGETEKFKRLDEFNAERDEES